MYFPEKPIRVTMLQNQVLDGEKEENLGIFVELIQKVVDESDPSTDLIIAPELFTTGYDFKKGRVQAETLPGPTTDIISAIIKGKCAFMGSILERRGPRLFNTAFLIDQFGTLAGRYRKIHLFSPMDEKKYLQPGRQISLLHCPIDSAQKLIIKIGVLLCYDIRFPELARVLVEQGAQLLVVLAEFPNPKLETWRTLVRARSIENQVPIIAVNRVGEGKKFSFFGHSTYFDTESGNELGETSEMWTGVVNFSIAQETREKIPCWADRRLDLYDFRKHFDRVFR